MKAHHQHVEERIESFHRAPLSDQCYLASIRPASASSSVLGNTGHRAPDGALRDQPGGGTLRAALHRGDWSL